MRIAVVGAHGVGKTTLARAIAEHLDITYIPESSRAVAQQRGIVSLEQPNADLVGIDFQFQCVTHQMGEEFKGSPFVVDRGLFDYVAYPLVLGVFRDEPQALRVYVDLIDENAYYTHVIYVPTRPGPIEPDGFRSTDPSFQHSIDRMIYMLYKSEIGMSVRNWIDLSGESPARWLDRALEALGWEAPK